MGKKLCQRGTIDYDNQVIRRQLPRLRLHAAGPAPARLRPQLPPAARLWRSGRRPPRLIVSYGGATWLYGRVSTERGAITKPVCLGTAISAALATAAGGGGRWGACSFLRLRVRRTGAGKGKAGQGRAGLGYLDSWVNSSLAIAISSSTRSTAELDWLMRLGKKRYHAGAPSTMHCSSARGVGEVDATLDDLRAGSTLVGAEHAMHTRSSLPSLRS